jgi:hypothetical protein
MKKYIKPAVELFEIETTSSIMQTSFRVNETTTTQDKVLESRQRGSEWSEYDGQ